MGERADSLGEADVKLGLVKIVNRWKRLVQCLELTTRSASGRLINDPLPTSISAMGRILFL